MIRRAGGLRLILAVVLFPTTLFGQAQDQSQVLDKLRRSGAVATRTNGEIRVSIRGLGGADAAIRLMASLPGIREVDLSSTSFSTDSLKLLAKSKTIETLLVANTRLTDRQLQVITQFANLTFLDLEDNPQLSFVGMSGKFSKLRRLTGVGPKVDRRLLQNVVRACPRLEMLGFQGSQFAKDSLKALQACRTLRELDFNSSEINDEELCNLKGTTVNRLALMGARRVTNAGLSCLRDLKLVYLFCDGDTKIDGRVASMFPSLRTLLVCVKSQAGYRSISSHKSLRVLHLIFSRKIALAPAGLSRLDRLERLELFDGRFTAEDVKELSALAKLTNLYMQNCRMPAGSLSRILRRQDKLKRFGISECRVTPNDVRTLAGIKGIEELTISGGRLGDTHVPELAKLGGIKRLKLDLSMLSNEGLEKLRMYLLELDE